MAYTSERGIAIKEITPEEIIALLNRACEIFEKIQEKKAVIEAEEYCALALDRNKQGGIE